MSAEKNTKDHYLEAIKKLEAISSDFETNDADREKANKAITVLRTKLQDLALDSIANRAANLRQLMHELDGVTQGHGHTGAAEAMSTLVSFSSEIKQIVDAVRGEDEDE